MDYNDKIVQRSMENPKNIFNCVYEWEKQNKSRKSNSKIMERIYQRMSNDEKSI